MDNMYVEKGSNVKINSQGYIDLVVIPQKYSLLIHTDSIFIEANGKMVDILELTLMKIPIKHV